jgi:hypothetical protein
MAADRQKRGGTRADLTMIFSPGFRTHRRGNSGVSANRQEIGRFSDPSGQRSKILRLTDFGSNAMIAGSSHAMWAESQFGFGPADSLTEFGPDPTDEIGPGRR